jgi:hypothetical protein
VAGYPTQNTVCVVVAKFSCYTEGFAVGQIFLFFRYGGFFPFGDIPSRYVGIGNSRSPIEHDFEEGSYLGLFRFGHT